MDLDSPEFMSPRFLMLVQIIIAMKLRVTILSF